MNVQGEVLLQLLNKSNLINGTKTFLETKFFIFLVKFKRLGFSVPLIFYKHKTVKPYQHTEVSYI